jgi:hypothetical protein
MLRLIEGARSAGESADPPEAREPDVRAQAARPQSRIAKAAGRLVRRFRRGAATPAPPSAGEGRTTSGVRKSALCKGASGEWCVVDFLLPADLAAKLGAPIEFRFLEGVEAVSPRQVENAIKASFLKGESVCREPAPLPGSRLGARPRSTSPVQNK